MAIVTACGADNDADDAVADDEVDADDEEPDEPHPARIAAARSGAVRDDSALVMTPSTAPDLTRISPTSR